MTLPYSPLLDEALLEHYNEQGRHVEYQIVLCRMRANGYTPTGPGAPVANPRPAQQEQKNADD